MTYTDAPILLTITEEEDGSFTAWDQNAVFGGPTDFLVAAADPDDAQEEFLKGVIERGGKIDNVEITTKH